MVAEEVTFLERRLSAKPLHASSTLFDRMIDDIDATEQTSPVEWEKVKQLKKDIIHRCILTGCGMVDHCQQDVLLEQEKYFAKPEVDGSTSKRQLELTKAIQSRRLHMLERGACVTQLKLATTFKHN